MTEQVKQKAKRKLKGFDFSVDGAAVALVGPSVGGPANSIPTLIAKANNFSPEFIKKMQAVQVTMELPDFLKRFFMLWEDEAEFLATMMGYVEPPEDEQAEAADDYNKWIEERFQSFSIIKSLHEAKNLPEALSKLTEDQYLDVLQDQVEIEKALKELDKESKDSEADTSTKVESKVEASASKKKTKKEKQMTQETETVEKSVLIAVEKAHEETRVALEKALKQLAEIEEANKQAIVKSKTEAVKAVIKDEKQAAVVVKAALALDTQEDFDALIEVFKAQNALIEKSALFQEQGVSAEANEDKPEESKLAKAIKSKYQQAK